MPGSGTSVYTGTVKFHVGCLGDTTVIGTHGPNWGCTRSERHVCVHAITSFHGRNSNDRGRDVEDAPL